MQQLVFLNKIKPPAAAAAAIMARSILIPLTIQSRKQANKWHTGAQSLYAAQSVHGETKQWTLCGCNQAAVAIRTGLRV